MTRDSTGRYHNEDGSFASLGDIAAYLMRLQMVWQAVSAAGRIVGKPTSNGAIHREANNAAFFGGPKVDRPETPNDIEAKRRRELWRK